MLLKSSGNRKISKKIIRLELSKKSDMRIFSQEKNCKSKDILSIAFGIFNLEKIIKKEIVRSIKIERFKKDKSSELVNILKELISVIYYQIIDIKFIYSRKKSLKKKKEITQKAKTVVLFSGGIDSVGGLFWANKTAEKNIVGVFCAHKDQKWAIKIVNDIRKNVFNERNMEIKTIYSPAISVMGYSQLRGYHYILSSGAWMNLLDADSLVISECGPTMYQPRFGPYDNVTMTTHPIVVEMAQKSLEILLERKISIYLPFEDMTKAEVIAYASMFTDIRNTHSCISQRFGRHDGTCYGCIIRKLGSITAGVRDVEYINDPLVDENANSDNLISLMLFCFDLLMNIESMPYYQIENILAFNKMNLFNRFALDNFAAVHLRLKSGETIVEDVKKIYYQLIERMGTMIIDERIDNVRGRKMTPAQKKYYSTNQ